MIVPPGESRSKGPLRVLVVEDNEDDSQLLLRELRKGAYEPTPQPGRGVPLEERC